MSPQPAQTRQTRQTRPTACGKADPGRATPPLASTAMATSFLEAVRTRVVIYDGATGTWLQEQGLTAADFAQAVIDAVATSSEFNARFLIAPSVSCNSVQRRTAAQASCLSGAPFNSIIDNTIHNAEPKRRA